MVLWRKKVQNSCTLDKILVRLASLYLNLTILGRCYTNEGPSTILGSQAFVFLSTVFVSVNNKNSFRAQGFVT
jgi:hypothetical protein